MSGSWSNNSITSLTIPTDATTGARIVIDGTTDAILMYNAANQLVAAIAASPGTDAGGNEYHAGVGTYSEGENQFVELSTDAPVIVFSQIAELNQYEVVILMAPDTVDGLNTFLINVASPGVGFGNGPGLNLTAGNGTPSFLSTIVASQQNPADLASLSGCMIQNDNTSGTAPKFMHTGIYSGIVSGSAGVVTFDHLAGFTPKFGLFTPLSFFSQGLWSAGFGVDGFTATQAQLIAYDPNGAFVGNGDGISFMAMFMA